jgi:hypothetical protein
MPALEPPLLADVAALLTGGRPLEDGPTSLPFHDPDGAHYRVTLEKLAAGFRMVVRPSRPPATAAAPPAVPAGDAKPHAWWAQPSEKRQSPSAPGELAAPPAAPAAAVQQRSNSSRSPSRYPT